MNLADVYLKRLRSTQEHNNGIKKIMHNQNDLYIYTHTTVQKFQVHTFFFF